MFESQRLMERRKTSQPIRVLFLPDYKRNPYQKALANALLKEDIMVDFGTVSFLFSTLRSCRNHWKPNILHLHWLDSLLLANNRAKLIFRSSTFLGELLIIKLLGIKIVWTVHNLISHEGEFSSLELIFTKLVARMSSKIIVHSSSAKKEVTGAYGVKDSLMIVIPHGNYISYYPNKISKNLARKKLKLGEKEIVFLFFGQIRSYKGVSELISTFKKLTSLRAKLLIVGKPYNKEIAHDVLKRCRGNKNIITYLKYISDDEVQIYMNAANIVVLPYKDVLTSGAIILAMSFAKPVIAPAMGCIPDVVDEKGGWLYEPTDKRGLLKAMQQSLKNNSIKKGEHNFKLVRRLQWEMIAKRTEEIYQKILEE